MAPALRTALKGLLGIAIFVGLPVLAWGPGDIKGFLGLPARRAYVAVVVLVQAFAVLTFPTLGSGRREGIETVGRQRHAVVFLQVLAPVVLLAAGYGDRRVIAPMAEGSVGRYTGILLFALGFLAVALAESALGRQFSVQVTLQKDHRLVTGGLYRHIRHPRYLGVLGFATGVSLAFNTWIALAVVGALAVVLLWRIGDEEALMRARFGSDWDSYCRRSWRLIPFVF